MVLTLRRKGKRAAMPARVTGLALSVLASAAVFAPAAGAAGPALSVTNLGQSSAPVEVGQPPLDMTASGGCAHPFTVANESACPAGTWPSLGRQWGQIEDVAGGDTLQLQFSSPVMSVGVGSTSNYEPGLHDPDGRAIPNYDVISESPATPTSDPAVWLVGLPQLDARAISTIGYTFSVVAQDGSGYYDYPFGIRSPRYADEATRCGVAYYTTGRQQRLCSGDSAPPGRPGDLRVVRAAYDGHVLVLRARVPSAGTLRVAVPTACGERGGGACHRRTWVAKHAGHAGGLVLRRALSLRLGPGRRMNLPFQFRESGGKSSGTLTVRVRSAVRRDGG